MPKINDRMISLVKQMKEAYGLYKADFKSRLSFLMRVEIKKLVDEKLTELDLGAMDGDDELNEPISQIEALKA